MKCIHRGSWCYMTLPPSSRVSSSAMLYDWSTASWRKTPSSSRGANSPLTRWSLYLSSAWTQPTLSAGAVLPSDRRSPDGLTDFTKCHQWQDERLWGTGPSYHTQPIPGLILLCRWHIHHASHELDWGVYQPHKLFRPQHQVHNRRRAGWPTILSGHLHVHHSQWRCTLRSTINHKPTHTDQYLNCHSNHHLEHKGSVVWILLRRPQTMVSGPSDQESTSDTWKRPYQQIDTRNGNLRSLKRRRKQLTPPAIAPKVKGCVQCAYPMCVWLYVCGYWITFSMCSGHMVWHLTSSHSTSSDPSW